MRHRGEQVFCTERCRQVTAFVAPQSGYVPPRAAPSSAPSDRRRTIRTHVLAHLEPAAPDPRRASRTRPRPGLPAPRAPVRGPARARRPARVPPASHAAARLARAPARRSGAGTATALHHPAGPLRSRAARTGTPPLTLGGRSAARTPDRGSRTSPGIGCGPPRQRPASCGRARNHHDPAAPTWPQARLLQFDHVGRVWFTAVKDDARRSRPAPAGREGPGPGHAGPVLFALRRSGTDHDRFRAERERPPRRPLACAHGHAQRRSPSPARAARPPDDALLQRANRALPKRRGAPHRRGST